MKVSWEGDPVYIYIVGLIYIIILFYIGTIGSAGLTAGVISQLSPNRLNIFYIYTEILLQVEHDMVARKHLKNIARR